MAAKHVPVKGICHTDIVINNMFGDNWKLLWRNYSWFSFSKNSILFTNLYGDIEPNPKVNDLRLKFVVSD